MPIPPRLHRGEVYHARVPPAALFVLAQNVATFVEAFLAIDALTWPAGAVGVVSKRLVRKNEKKVLARPRVFYYYWKTRGRGGIGRRVWFRSIWGQPREGSSPFARTTD